MNIKAYLLLVMLISFLLLPSALSQVPAIDEADSDYYIGTFYMPAWNMQKHFVGWDMIESFSARKPLLGYYDEGNPEVMDWEIKWQKENGVNFIIFDWWRCNPGECPKTPSPITTETLNTNMHVLHEAFFESEYGNGDKESDMKFALMITPNSMVKSIYSKEDAQDNVMPFIIDTYFNRPNYLKIDNKPVLFHYNIFKEDGLRDQVGKYLGITDEVRLNQEIKDIINVMKQKTIEAGYDGLIFIGENRYPYDDSTLDERTQLSKDFGFDATFAYVWPLPGDLSPSTDQEAVDSQMEIMEYRKDANILPFIPNVDMGWDDVRAPDNPNKWKLQPNSYKTLLQRVKSMMDALPNSNIGSKMITVGAWNEYAEGHYLSPTSEYGFDYLKAIRDVFTNKQNTPDYRLPEDVGMGPYDSIYQAFKKPRLLLYYDFEGNANDQSGEGRNGNALGNIQLSEGRIGQAYQFDGTNSRVSYGVKDTFLEGMSSLSFGMFVKPDELRENTFILEKTRGFRIATDSDGSGYCAVGTVVNEWGSSGTMAKWPAGKIKANEWQHVLCVYDGSHVMAYINGKKVATSPGSISTNIDSNTMYLSIGAKRDGDNWFKGAVDEVKIWNYALSATQIAREASGATSSATLNATPNPCTLNESGKCTTTLSWESDLPLLQLRYSVNHGPESNAGCLRTSSGTKDIDWVGKNTLTFKIYKVDECGWTGGVLLDEVDVTGITADKKTATITASPNPCYLNNSGKCTTTLSWDSDLPFLQLRYSVNQGIESNAGCLRSSSGTQDIDWVGKNTLTFKIYKVDECGGTGGVLLDEVNVTGIYRSPYIWIDLIRMWRRIHLDFLEIQNGDLDGDHKITEKDIEILASYLNGQTTEISRLADYNEDGAIDEEDLFCMNLLLSNLSEYNKQSCPSLKRRQERFLKKFIYEFADYVAGLQ